MSFDKNVVDLTGGVYFYFCNILQKKNEIPTRLGCNKPLHSWEKKSAANCYLHHKKTKEMCLYRVFEVAPRHRRLCLLPCAGPLCAYPRHPWEISWRRGIHDRRAALGCHHLGRLPHNTPKVGHRVFRDIRGRQGAFECGL